MTGSDKGRKKAILGVFDLFAFVWPRIAPGRSGTDFYTLLGHILKFFVQTPPPEAPSYAVRPGVRRSEAYQ